MVATSKRGVSKASFRSSSRLGLDDAVSGKLLRSLPWTSRTSSTLARWLSVESMG
ncbi:hypothetical protein COSO111634_19360 [Corallococcus soli]